MYFFCSICGSNNIRILCKLKHQIYELFLYQKSSKKKITLSVKCSLWPLIASPLFFSIPLSKPTDSKKKKKKKLSWILKLFVLSLLVVGRKWTGTRQISVSTGTLFQTPAILGFRRKDWSHSMTWIRQHGADSVAHTWWPRPDLVFTWEKGYFSEGWGVY